MQDYTPSLNKTWKQKTGGDQQHMEYIHAKDLPKAVNELFQQRRQQNKQAARLLHFRCDNKVLAKEFLYQLK